MLFWFCFCVLLSHSQLLHTKAVESFKSHWKGTGLPPGLMSWSSKSLYVSLRLFNLDCRCPRDLLQPVSKKKSCGAAPVRSQGSKEESSASIRSGNGATAASCWLVTPLGPPGWQTLFPAPQGVNHFRVAVHGAAPPNGCLTTQAQSSRGFPGSEECCPWTNKTGERLPSTSQNLSQRLRSPGQVQ